MSEFQPHDDPAGELTRSASQALQLLLAVQRQLIDRAAHREQALTGNWQTAQHSYAPMLDEHRARRASAQDALRAWAAAEPHAGTDVDAAIVTDRCERRLRDLQPTAMQCYDELSRQGQPPTAAMQQAVALMHLGPVEPSVTDELTQLRAAAGAAAEEAPASRTALLGSAQPLHRPQAPADTDAAADRDQDLIREPGVDQLQIRARQDPAAADAAARLGRQASQEQLTSQQLASTSDDPATVRVDEHQDGVDASRPHQLAAAHRRTLAAGQAHAAGTAATPATTAAAAQELPALARSGSASPLSTATSPTAAPTHAARAAGTPATRTGSRLRSRGR